MKKLTTYYGLPTNVTFCTRCVLPNQRPSSIPEFTHRPSRKGAMYLHFNEEGVCDACQYAERKEQIDWRQREDELMRVLDKYRRSDGGYDCMVPGSGGKDSGFAAHILKYKYGMHPLTVTWPPTLYTDYGYKNYRNWIDIGGFDNVTFRPNGRTHRLLTRLSIENILHPFQTFILGQKFIASKVALKYNIPLIFYGENEAEYGNPIADNSSSLRSKSYFTYQHLNDLYLAGIPLRVLIDKYGLTMNDLLTYLPVSTKELANSKIEVHYLGYYLRWVPQEAYYYAVEHTGFNARPFRSEGTYSKYNSIDDKIDDLHFYTTYIKFGFGRATYDASQEIRNKHLTREEGIALVKRFDGEFPNKYFDDVMEYIGMTKKQFLDLCDKFRSPHLWKKAGGVWKLRHTIWGGGTDD